VASHLDCSESYVASIVQQIMLDNPNLHPVVFVESVVEEFHQRRRDLCESIRFAFELAEMGAEEDSPQSVLHAIYSIVKDELATPAFVSKLLDEIDKLGNLLSKAENEKNNARSETVPPSTEQSV
jgi:nuclear pore complex protein Nup205